MVPVPSDELRIVVARQVDISGTVTDGGKPVAAANVGMRGDAIGGTLEVKTDAKGAFDVPNLPEGRYQVYACRGALAARTVRVARLGAGPFAPVELRLEAAQIVVGRVIDRDEAPGSSRRSSCGPSARIRRRATRAAARTAASGSRACRTALDRRRVSPAICRPGGVELEAGRVSPSSR